MAVLNHAIYDSIPYQYIEEKDLSNPPEHDLFVGSVEGVRMVLESKGLTLPNPNYYPSQLSEFLHRKVWEGTATTVLQEIAQGNRVFAKPRHKWKSFTGQLFTQNEGYTLISSLDPKEPLWLSEEVDIRSEFRAYVTEGKLTSICQYTGDYDDDEILDTASVLNATSILKQSGYQTDTYAFDWAITKERKTIFLEMNDAFGIGRYKGISDAQYYKFLLARWQTLNKI
ncbi:ATP-grasp domain-containing protein [Vibrio sp. D431a]|uniref:ATP-grasp domain-containing protein n=1 Tax=Vibrio sp. D431a TaxID=2837388 RepID=UPI002552B5D3|nr:ATP-grasp domain-containing protein [Vibrio sp. D431a]MDK9790057.1 ATP-grasp domain-containing protein [Vibrio sp. D431a]